MQNKSKAVLNADDIAEMATRGEDVSKFFTNSFFVIRPVRRVNIDFAQEMLRDLDARAARLNISRQAIIKTLLQRAMDQDSPARPGKKR